jgi:hypothetical protein
MRCSASARRELDAVREDVRASGAPLIRDRHRLGAAGALLALALTSCNLDPGAGYVEIKALPPSAVLPLYLDQVKLEPLRNGNAVLRQKVGIVKLQTDIDGAGHMAFLCNVEVKKNRITSVTVSVMSRQPRCQCGRTSASESGPNRTCIG